MPLLFFSPPHLPSPTSLYSSNMNFQDYPSGKSPRRELQGPRPTPLKVRKDSHKVKKPPVAPQHHHHHHQNHPQQPPQQHRPPVIIYTVSPKVIHTNPNDFMTLVQRLTGSTSSTYSMPSPAAATTSFSSFQDDGGAVSPAARFASVEKIKSPSEGRRSLAQSSTGGDMEMVEGVEINAGLEKTGLFPGILSPGPGSLPPIPPNFFSPATHDLNPLSSFFHDLSPNLHSNRNYIEGSSFLPSPSNLLSSHITSPSSLDLFSNYFDF